MSIESYIAAMPKVDLSVSLDGAARKQVWLLIADQNEIGTEDKHFPRWRSALGDPDPHQIDELRRVVCGWLQYPEDITRLVYDAGVSLSKQQVRYAEINVNPVLHMLNGMTFDDFAQALNDGRDRAERGWGIQMRWIMEVPREEPRRADETVRWSTGITARRSGVVGFGLGGREDAQPVGQFDRSFQIASKKDLPTAVRAGSVLGAEGIRDVIDHLHPNRLITSWNILEDAEMASILIEHGIPIAMNPLAAQRQGTITSSSDLPIAKMLDEGLTLVIYSEQPEWMQTPLERVYLDLIETHKLSVDDINAIVLESVRSSFLDEDTKIAMVREFEAEFETLMAQHLVASSSPNPNH